MAVMTHIDGGLHRARSLLLRFHGFSQILALTQLLFLNQQAILLASFSQVLDFFHVLAHRTVIGVALSRQRLDFILHKHQHPSQ
jgi:hypothetical protein